MLHKPCSISSPLMPPSWAEPDFSNDDPGKSGAAVRDNARTA